MPGDSIVNRAAIYFDYNSAILTLKNVVYLVSASECSNIVTKNIYDTVCVVNNYVFYGDTLNAPGTYVRAT